MGDTGPEHIQKSPEKQRVTSASGAESGAVPPSEPAQLPSELTEIVGRWPRLTVAMQAGILAIIRASV
jgi:hypothetical protein